jgi:hypothetical protein
MAAVVGILLVQVQLAFNLEWDGSGDFYGQRAKALTFGGQLSFGKRMKWIVDISRATCTFFRTSLVANSSILCDKALTRA